MLLEREFLLLLGELSSVVMSFSLCSVVLTLSVVRNRSKDVVIWEKRSMDTICFHVRGNLGFSRRLIYLKQMH